MVECERLENLPTILEILPDAPKIFLGLYSLSLACALISIILYRFHYLKLLKQPPTKRRDLYVNVIRTGPVYCVCGFLALVFPRACDLFRLLSDLYEAWALYQFGLLLINYIAGQNEHDYRAAREKCSNALQKLPPARFFRVPPFGIFFLCGPLSAPRSFDGKMVRLVTRLLIQFLYIGPAIGILRLWYDLQCIEPFFEGAALVLSFIRIVSILLAVWGLLIIYMATRLILYQYSTSYKFLALKGALLLTGTQNLFIPNLFHFLREDKEGEKFTSKFLSQFWLGFLICIEGCLMTILLVHAYPVREISPSFYAPQHPKTPLIKRASGYYVTSNRVLNN